MPLIQVQMFTGRTPQQKRDLVRALTDAFVETAGSGVFGLKALVVF